MPREVTVYASSDGEEFLPVAKKTFSGGDRYVIHEIRFDEVWAKYIRLDLVPVRHFMQSDYYQVGLGEIILQGQPANADVRDSRDSQADGSESDTANIKSRPPSAGSERRG